MFERIVLAVDDPDHARGAVAAAVDLATTSRGQVLIVHVHDTWLVPRQTVDSKTCDGAGLLSATLLEAARDVVRREGRRAQRPQGRPGYRGGEGDRASRQGLRCRHHRAGLARARRLRRTATGERRLQSDPVGRLSGRRGPCRRGERRDPRSRRGTDGGVRQASPSRDSRGMLGQDATWRQVPALYAPI